MALAVPEAVLLGVGAKEVCSLSRVFGGIIPQKIYVKIFVLVRKMKKYAKF